MTLSLIQKANKARQSIYGDLQLLNLSNPVTQIGTRPRSGKTLGLSSLLNEAAAHNNGEKIVVATTTRLLAAKLYDLMAQTYSAPPSFARNVLLHIGRGVGMVHENIDGNITQYDLTTCHADEFGIVSAKAAHGESLTRHCAQCPHNLDCRYLYTRRRALFGGYNVLITTLSTLEFFNPPCDVFVIDEMNLPPTLSTSWSDLAKINESLAHISTEYPAVQQLMSALLSTEQSVDAPFSEIKADIAKIKKTAAGTALTGNALFTFLTSTSRRIIAGQTADGWIFARLPYWRVLNQDCKILYCDATPSKFAAAIFDRPITVLKKDTFPWPIGVTINIGSTGRAALNRLGDSPAMRYAAVRQNTTITPARQKTLGMGIKSAHKDFYLWGARGQRGGEGARHITLLASMYQLPAPTLCILTHLLLNADEEATTDWVNLQIGRLPYDDPHRGVPVMYPYPVVRYDKSTAAQRATEDCYLDENKKPVFCALSIISDECLQLIGRAFTSNLDCTSTSAEEDNSYKPKKSRVEINVSVLGVIPGLNKKAQWVTVRYFDRHYVSRIMQHFRAVKKGYEPKGEQGDYWRKRFAPPITRFMVLKKGKITNDNRMGK